MTQVDAGFLEGIVRGYKAGLLTQNQYNNLTQCETIEGALTMQNLGNTLVEQRCITRLQNATFRNRLWQLPRQ